jgi:hypothetical protein
VISPGCRDGARGSLLAALIGLVRLVVATVLLVAMAVAAKIAIERVAPEEVASASTRVTSPGRAKPEAGTVQSVRFTGPGLRAAFLSEVVATREGQPFDEAALASDRQRIVDALIARGHLDAAVGAPQVEWSDGAAWIDFPVEPGTLHVVRSVRVVGKQLRAHPGLADVPTLVAGNDAVAERIEASARLLRDWLAQRNLRATVTVTIDVEKYGKQIDVTYRVD